MTEVAASLSKADRTLMLLAGFTAWMFAGLENSLFVLIHRQMMLELLTQPATSPPSEQVITQWFAWNQAALMGGAAVGGWCFGWLGDRSGRTRALGWSVVCYSVLTLAGWWIHDPVWMWIARFIACLGFGGTWPNAVALVAEAYPSASRPFLAGLLGTAANFGFVLMGLIGYFWPVTETAWRWTLIVGGAPILLGGLILVCVPESVRWLAARKQSKASVASGESAMAGSASGAASASVAKSPFQELFRPPLLSRTVIGILLGSIPVIGTAANANLVVPWSDQVASERQKQELAEQQTVSESASGQTAGEKRSTTKPTNAKPKQSSRDKAWTMVTRSSGAIIGSLLGGIIASLVGRRLSYFLISLGTFAVSSWLFTQLKPGDPGFSVFVFLLGLFGVTYFGWLPLFLPELFPTRVRATGSGISFNSGRIAAAAVVVLVGLRMNDFGGSYAMIGFWTGWIYVAGMLVIWFAPQSPAETLDAEPVVAKSREKAP